MTVDGDPVQPPPAQAPCRPLRVALVSETYPPEVNGVVRTLVNLTGDLMRWGNEVLLVLPSHPAGRNGTPCPPETRCVPSVRLPFYPEARLALPLPGSVLRTLRQFHPDVVHLVTEGPLGLAALQAARRLGLPCVSSYHTNFPMYLRAYRCGALAEPAWTYLRWFHNRTAATLCPTAALQKTLEERGFKRLTVWGRGVDTSLFSPEKRREPLRVEQGARPGDVVLLYVGRLAAEKNLEALLAAFGLLRGQGAPVKLWLVGDGPARRHLERRAGPGVRFTGFQQGEALAATYASADLFNFASLTETFGNVLQEAMASGLPVVALRAPGSEECVRHGTTGLLVDGATPAALAHACDTLVRDEDTRRRLGRKAHEAMLGRSWEAANAVVRDLYGTVRGPGRAGRLKGSAANGGKGG